MLLPKVQRTETMVLTAQTEMTELMTTVLAQVELTEKLFQTEMMELKEVTTKTMVFAEYTEMTVLMTTTSAITDQFKTTEMMTMLPFRM